MPGRLLVAFVRSTPTPNVPLTWAVGRSGESRKYRETESLALLPPKTASDLHTALGQIFSKVSSGRAHFFTKSNQFVVTVKGAVLPGP